MLPDVRLVSAGHGIDPAFARALPLALSFDPACPAEAMPGCMRLADHAFLLDLTEANPLGWRYLAQDGIDRLKGAAKAASTCLGEHVDQGFTRGVLIPSYLDVIAADQPAVHRIAAVSNDTFLSYHRLTVPLYSAPRAGQASRLLMLTRLDFAIPQIRSLRGAARRLAFRERQCLWMAAGGLAAKQMAVEIGVSEKTIELHLACARRKLGARTTAQAVAISMAMAMMER